ncbi:MAG: hypothetical protein QOF54_1539 [Solirubrobacteraceae bacterium]|nr:hypothetical protein [Solirubrobacteraceae bacterium]
MEIDRQGIERRDFPITRRGYEPAAVDAHLRALASEIEQLQRERAAGGAEPSLASTAGSQVQSILAAAEAAAADIERQAREDASAARETAEHDAGSTREQAIAQARAHVSAVSQATAVLLERVGALDGEVGALLDSLRAGAGRLASDLGVLDAEMGALYDAASGKAVTQAIAADVPSPPAIAVPPPPPRAPRPSAAAPARPPTPPAPSGAAAPQVRPPQTSPPPLSPADDADPDVHLDPEAPAGTDDNGDLDGARLVALNMALNGESREDAERYLAEHYTLADRRKLIAEVYAAIEG